MLRENVRRSKATPRVMLATLFTCLAISAPGQNKSSDPSGALGGDWEVILRPYSGPGAESMPLQVIKVAGTAGGPVTWVREQQMRNQSDKAVVRASFTAFVYRKERPEVVLFKHPLPYRESYARMPIRPGMSWPAPCRPEPAYCPYGHAMPGVAALLAPLVEGGELQGRYEVAIAATKVWFEDGSAWEYKEGEPPTPNKGSEEPPPNIGMQRSAVTKALIIGKGAARPLMPGVRCYSE